jgi:hypothetical protein
MIYPVDLYMTQNEFDSIIKNAETNFMETRASYPPDKRSNCVQFWVKMYPAQVSTLYIEDLIMSYKEAGWKHVEVTFTDENTRLMIYLNNN